jgi:MFS family permease
LSSNKWDRRYEVQTVLLMSLAFGVVGLDRFIINPLFPVMVKDLGLDYQDLGLVSGVLALAWGTSSMIGGRLSDRRGQKAVIVPAVIGFSAVVGLTGLATGLGTLLLLRALVGFAEGAFAPTAIVATARASKPSRVGLNIGLQQVALPLFGLGIGPVLATQLLKVLPSWHWVFVIAAAPGFVIAIVIVRVLRNDDARTFPVPVPTHHAWREVLAHRSVIFNAIGMCCWVSCLVILSALLPNYLTDHLKLGLGDMGWVLSGQGIGSLAGAVTLPALSDRYGRRLVLLLSVIVEIVALSAFMRTGATPPALFALLLVASWANAGNLTITIGPLTIDSVPHDLVNTATGIVVGLGEIVGGALAPAAAGGLAQHAGIAIVPALALGAIVVGFAVTVFGIREPQKEHERWSPVPP